MGRGKIKESITNTFGQNSLLVNKGKQSIHDKTSKKYVKGRSYLLINVDDVQSVIDSHLETGTHINAPYGNKVRIYCDKIIGIYVDPVTKKEYPTSVGIVHFSKKGSHLVPQRPLDWSNKGE